MQRWMKHLMWHIYRVHLYHLVKPNQGCSCTFFSFIFSEIEPAKLWYINHRYRGFKSIQIQIWKFVHIVEMYFIYNAHHVMKTEADGNAVQINPKQTSTIVFGNTKKSWCTLVTVLSQQYLACRRYCMYFVWPVAGVVQYLPIWLVSLL